MGSNPTANPDAVPDPHRSNRTFLPDESDTVVEDTFNPSNLVGSGADSEVNLLAEIKVELAPLSHSIHALYRTALPRTPPAVPHYCILFYLPYHLALPSVHTMFVPRIAPCSALTVDPLISVNDNDINDSSSQALTAKTNVDAKESDRLLAEELTGKRMIIACYHLPVVVKRTEGKLFYPNLTLLTIMCPYTGGRRMVA